MTLTEEIYEAAGKAAPSGTDEALLQRLCRAAEQQLRARLKDAVQPDDCRDAFVCAAAWMALAGVQAGRSAALGCVERFTVGEVSVQTSGAADTAGDTAVSVRAQAEQLMQPYCRESGFSFVGVRG